LFIIFLLAVSSFPAEAIVGVKSGDWAKYSFNMSWQSTISDLPEPSDLMSVKWVRFEVENVFENDITANVATHFENGTETSSILSGNVLTQTGNLAMMFIQAELEQGDSIRVATSYTDSTATFTIDETISRDYIGVTREVNHLDVSFSSAGYDMYIFGYWDKATGVACEIEETVSYYYAGESMLFSMSLTLTETNIWGLSPIWVQWWFWVAIVVIVVAIVVSFVFIRKHRRRTVVEAETSEPSQNVQPKDFQTSNFCPNCGARRKI